MALNTVIFDLDGTLVDSLPDLHGTLNGLLAASGRRAVEAVEVRPMIGDGAAKLVERAFAATGNVPPPPDLADLVHRFLDRYHLRATALTRPYPGAVAALDALCRRGLRLAVCTNKPAEATAVVLAGLGLSGYFDCVVGGDSIPGRRKPDPAPVLACLDSLACRPRDAVMVGDSEADVAAARAAGIPVIACGFGYARVPAADLGADAVIHGFAELPAALAQVVQ